MSLGQPVTGVDCGYGMNGIQIESDLKLDQFIWDKATVAVSSEPTTAVSVGGLKQNPFGTFQTTLTFVASFGASVTPTWHIEQVIVNPGSPFFSATRMKTDTLPGYFWPATEGKPSGSCGCSAVTARGSIYWHCDGGSQQSLSVIRHCGVLP